MHALRKAYFSDAEASDAVAETERLLLCPAEHRSDGRAFDLTVVAKADWRVVARMTFVAGRGQEARLSISLGSGPGSPELMAEAAGVAVPMAMAALGTRILRAAADAGDQAMIGVLRRFGMRARGGADPIRTARTLEFEKDLCGIM